MAPVSPLSELAPEPEAPPPLVLDRTSKMQLGILLGTNLLVQMGIGMIIVVLPIFAQSLGLGGLGVGLLVALPQLTKLILNLPVGHLIDVVGRRPPLVAGALIDALGQFGTALSVSLTQLVPARLLVGMGSATGGTATTAYTMDVVGKFPEHSGLLLGMVQAIGFLAFALGPVVGGMLSERGGPALPFMVLGAILTITAPLKALLPETAPPRRKKESPGGEEGVDEAPRGPWAEMRKVMVDSAISYKQLLADRQQVALLMLKLAFFSGLSLILTVVPLHATAAWGASTVQLGHITSFVTLLSLVASPLAGLLADRVGRRPLAVGGSAATAIACACLPWCHGRHSYYAVRSVWAIGEAFLITAYTTLALDVTRAEQRGARSSLDNQVGDVALLFLPLLLGATGQLVSHAAAFRLGAVLMLGCNFAFARLIRIPAAHAAASAASPADAASG